MKAMVGSMVCLALTAGLGLGGTVMAKDKIRFEFENTKNRTLETTQPVRNPKLFEAFKSDHRQFVMDTDKMGLGPASVRPLLPGTQMPSFRLVGFSGNQIHVDPDKLERPLVLTFFRGGWCPYCNLHLAELRHAEQQLADMGFDVWFISPDKPNPEFDEDQPGAGYTVYSDSMLEAAKAFGVAYQVEQDILDRFFAGGRFLQEASGESHTYLPTPGTFIIGTDGVIQFQYVNPNYKVRLDPDVLLAAAESYLAMSAWPIAQTSP